MEFTLAPETIQVLGVAAESIGLGLTLLVVAAGLVHFGATFIATQL